MSVEFLGAIDASVPFSEWCWIEGIVVRTLDIARLEVEYGAVNRREIIRIAECGKGKLRVTTVRRADTAVFVLPARDNWLDRYNMPDDEGWRVPNMNMPLFTHLETINFVTRDTGDGCWGFTEKGLRLSTECRAVLLMRLFNEAGEGPMFRAEAEVLKYEGFDCNGYSFPALEDVVDYTLEEV